MKEKTLTNLIKMEILELEQPQTEAPEKLLIYESLLEVGKVRQEIESRCSILNKLTEFGLTTDEIKATTHSLNDIDKFIHKRAIAGNTKLKELIDAGIKPEYTLPVELENLSFALKAFFNYRVPDSNLQKFSLIKFTDAWVINENALENYLIGKRLKFYITGDDINEYAFLESFCKYLELKKAPSNQIAQSSFFKNRIEILGRHNFKPNWTYFRRENQNHDNN